MNSRKYFGVIFVSATLLGITFSLAKILMGAQQAPPWFADNPLIAEGYDSEKERRDTRREILFDVFFRTPQQGWAAGGDGTVFSTTDGGKTWIKRKIADQELHHISFQDEKTGWIVGEKDLFRSIDAGRNWTRRAPPDARATGPIRFVTPQIGWLLGKDGLIFNTQDGGKSWQRRTARTKEALLDIACLSKLSCIITGEKKTILATSDGGRTWIDRSPSINDYYNINSVQLTPDGTAWALAVAYKNGYLLRSTNRGQTWEIASSSRLFDDFPPAIHFFDRQQGILLDTSIWFTEDGGVTWDMGWKGGPWLSAFFFLNDRLGWAVGDDRTILHTSDGGKTWTKQYEELKGPLIPYDR